MPRWVPVADDPPLPTADDYRARADRARAAAHSRYHTELTTILDRQGIVDAAAVATAAMEALFQWRDIDTGERCRCHCHPQLPETDLHDYGASCRCTRTVDERRASFHKALKDIRAYWQSPEGKRSQAAQDAADAELHAWVAQHPGVVVHSHGGWAPEQWRGEVDGHSFYFRERHDDWHLEIDLRPAGQVPDAMAGHTDSGTTHRQREFEVGDIIATGTIYAEGYGSTVVERGRFIVDTIRTHLHRRACEHCADELDAIAATLGASVDWCPRCGVRLTVAH